MDFVKSNFPHNSLTPCVLPMELPNVFVLNAFQLHWAVDNICILDRPMLVALVSIGDIQKHQSFYLRNCVLFWDFDDCVCIFNVSLIFRVEFFFRNLEKIVLHNTRYTPWSCMLESMG